MAQRMRMCCQDSGHQTKELGLWTQYFPQALHNIPHASRDHLCLFLTACGLHRPWVYCWNYVKLLRFWLIDWSTYRPYLCYVLGYCVCVCVCAVLCVHAMLWGCVCVCSCVCMYSWVGDTQLLQWTWSRVALKFISWTINTHCWHENMIHSYAHNLPEGVILQEALPWGCILYSGPVWIPSDVNLGNVSNPNYWVQVALHTSYRVQCSKITEVFK